MYGVIDIGSNTIRLSIYKKSLTAFTPMFNKKVMAGLAGYVNKAGCLSSEGIQIAITSLLELRQVLENLECKEVFVFATASLRNIKNTEEATASITKHTGFNIDLVSGQDEAKYGFLGATCFLSLTKGVLTDIGGGSTELVCYENGNIKQAVSLPMGSLNLYTNFVSDILPTQKELSAIRKHVRGQLDNVTLPDDFHLSCGVGGTVRASCKLACSIYKLSPSNHLLLAEHLTKMLTRFCERPNEMTTSILKAIPDRIHTILPGMAILCELIERYSAQTIWVSDYGVREGYLYTKLFK